VSRRYARRGAAARRRLAALLALTALVAAAALVAIPLIKRVVRDLGYPLSDTAIINRQAAAEHLDPALVAAVIYAETKFDARTSPAGALGLMQVEPATARLLAHMSGGYAFKVADLAHPATNIAYGSYYLRYLLNLYHGSRTLALAAYNAGPTNVDDWVARARDDGRSLSVAAIPFPQTRAYVVKVESAEKTYRRDYAKELGPP
jgi:soluble lytic murein transglycosylase